MAQKQTKVVSRRKKFLNVEIPLIKKEVSLIGNEINDVLNRKIKFDLTRQLRGKSVEAIFKVVNANEKPVAVPVKFRLMPYYIRRMIRKRISYVEDSFTVPTQESLVRVKPFLITRKKVSRAVRRTLRNQTRNWIEDYFSQKKDEELFKEIFSNKLQKPLSLKLKKTYPLSLCEIRVMEIVRPLEEKEIPKLKKVEKKEEKKEEIEEGLDQMKEIEEEIKRQEIEEAEKEIKETQKKASEIEAKESKEKNSLKEDSEKKEKKDSKEKTKKKE